MWCCDELSRAYKFFSLVFLHKDNNTSDLLTLGSLLCDWCPDIFCRNDEGDIEPKQLDTCWTVQGIHVALSTNLVDLWKSLSCPDHFLYILISTKV